MPMLKPGPRSPEFTAMTTTASNYLDQLVIAQKKGQQLGIPAVCSANPCVLDSCARLAYRCNSVLLIESTCNQVNHQGGYTGMTPSQFRKFVLQVASHNQLPVDRLILGGDHLGTNPWKNAPTVTAMSHARQMVRDYVAAGYNKIHLDASVHCADDDLEQPLPKEISAERTAELCLVAEDAADQRDPETGAPRYVIGSEVPVPGGSTSQDVDLEVTSTTDAQETIEITRQAFAARGLEDAWERVIALVVQPGVEFGDGYIHPYRPENAAHLTQLIKGYAKLVFETHSTDYQTKDALGFLVRDHFAILKVGPALTFAYREALFSLALMEDEWLSTQSSAESSKLIHITDQVMCEQPDAWKNYYQGSESYLNFARKYSLSDRIRYYWPSPILQEAISRLIANLELHPPPLTLISQFMPGQYHKIRSGELVNTPKNLIRDKIEEVFVPYLEASGMQRSVI